MRTKLARNWANFGLKCIKELKRKLVRKERNLVKFKKKYKKKMKKISNYKNKII